MRESLYVFCKRERRQELLAQWAEDKNLPLTPALISRGSKRKVWWRCEKEHVWQAAVYTRTGSGSGCPVCTGKVVQPGENDLAARFPKLASQWHPTRTAVSLPCKSCPAAIAWSGGSVKKDTRGGRRSNPGWPAAAARSAQTVRYPPAKTVWLPSTPGWLLSGTLPEMRG